MAGCDGAEEQRRAGGDVGGTGAGMWEARGESLEWNWMMKMSRTTRRKVAEQGE